MRVLFVGDIVGKSGRNALAESIGYLTEKYHQDLLIVNGENSAHGKGITKKIYDFFVSLGVDCITLGNHAFSKSIIYDFIDSADRMIRPYNMEPQYIGNSCKLFDFGGVKVGVYNIYGTIFIEGATESPYSAFDKLLKEYPSDIRIVDLHAEATSEKYAFMQANRNRVQMIVGTHTHIQTADEAIFDKCAFICDVGMTGPYDSVLGRDTEEVLDSLVKGLNTKYVVSENPAVLSAVVVDIDLQKREAVNIERIQLRPNIEK